MSWRRVALLYLLAGGLAVEWLRLARLPPPREPGDTRAVRPRFLGVEASAIRRLRVVHGGRVLVAERGPDGWVVREPPEAPVSAGLVDAFVSALASAETIAQAADGSGDLSSYGLDDRAVRIELLNDADAATVVLLGGQNPTGTSVYARRGGDSPVVVIGRNVAYYEDLLFQALPPPQVPAEIRDPVGG